jgi:hypothetical protein
MADPLIPNDMVKIFASQADKQNNLLIAACVTTIFNIISVVANLLIQFRLKDKEKDINKAKLREDKRIIIYESIFDKMTFMSLSTQGEEEKILIDLIKNLDEFINIKRLYIHSKDFKLLQKFNDYFRTLLTNPKLKDFAEEKKLIEEFVKNFNS